MQDIIFVPSFLRTDFDGCCFTWIKVEPRCLEECSIATYRNQPFGVERSFQGKCIHGFFCANAVGISLRTVKKSQEQKGQLISFRSFLTFTSTAPERNKCELNFPPSLIMRSFGALHSSYPLLHAHVLDFPASH